MEKGTITIRYLQEYLKHKQGQCDGTDDPQIALIKLSEELGELARVYLRGETHATCADDLKGSMEEEVFDILYYLLRFANAEGMDLERWIPLKEALNNRRFPCGIVFDPTDDSFFTEDSVKNTDQM